MKTRKKRNIFVRLYNYIKRQCRWFAWWAVTYCPVFPSEMFHSIRPFVWRLLGARLGKKVCIGFGVYLDVDGARLISIGENTIITSECLLLTHRRDLSKYHQGMSCQDIPYIEAPIRVGKNVQIGMRSIIMPGVEIGEGAVIGAHSTVTKDIPAWSIAVGSPAKVISTVKE